MSNYDEDENAGKFDAEQNQDANHDGIGPDKDDSVEPVLNAGAPNDPDKLLDGGAAKALPVDSEQPVNKADDATTSANDYEVGYGKPPKNTQFKKGHSGNEKGRPKGRRNFKTDLEINLASKVKVNKNGKTIKLSRQELIIDAQSTRAAKGDPKSANLIFGLIGKYLSDDPNGNLDKEISAEDAQILATFAARFNNSNPNPNPNPDPDPEIETIGALGIETSIERNDASVCEQIVDQNFDDHPPAEPSVEAAAEVETPETSPEEDGPSSYGWIPKNSSEPEPDDTFVNQDAASAIDDKPWWV